MTKYAREEKSRWDKEQTILIGHGIAKNPHHYARKLILFTFSNKLKVFCPFCLYQDEMNKFFIITEKQKIHKSLGKCPECKNEMMLLTLMNMNEYTMQEYAKFVFNYRLTGFWKKCPFDKWKERLKNFADFQDFWDEYKRLKGEETYSETE